MAKPVLDEETDNTKLSGAFIIVVILHIVAVVGIVWFTKARDSKHSREGLKGLVNQPSIPAEFEIGGTKFQLTPSLVTLLTKVQENLKTQNLDDKSKSEIVQIVYDETKKAYHENNDMGFMSVTVTANGKTQNFLVNSSYFADEKVPKGMEEVIEKLLTGGRELGNLRGAIEQAAGATR